MANNILVTGGASGIGYAICKKFASKGYNLFFTYNQSEREAEALLEELSQFNILFNGYKCNFESADAITQLYQDINNKYGGLDILINNSGISNIDLITDISNDDFDKIINVNVKAAFLLSKLCIPKMISQKWGRIINISSIWGERGASMESVYSASKHALNGLTKSLALELAPSNINVNGIAPGIINTKMTEALGQENKQKLLEDIPLKRFGEVEEVANLAYFLASEADYITGQIITIDGGFTL